MPPPDVPGLLLINLGTPQAPRIPEVRRYLQSNHSAVAKEILGATPEAIEAETRATFAEQHQKGVW